MSIEKYLSNYSEPETAYSELVTSTYQYVLCIPVFAEPVSYVDRLKHLPVSEPALVILVINAPDNCNPDLLRQTRALLDYCHSTKTIQRTDGAALHELAADPVIHLLTIDRCAANRQIPHKQGVGLARKIAADTALTLINMGRIRTPWIFFGDADVTFPDGYFDAVNVSGDQTTSTVIYPFLHTPHDQPEIRLCQTLYDFTLYYYVQGLRYAGSSCAWQSLGSTLAVSARHYALVRGVPRRNAGEDFHLINKLSKTGRVIQLESPVLEITTRQSARVPFGTGPSLNRLLAEQQTADTLEVYAPEIFHMLKLALKGLVDSYPLVRTQRPGKTAPLFDGWCDMKAMKKITEILDQLETAAALNSAVQNSTGEASYRQHVTHWFDALKTLRFIHLMRDRYFPSPVISQIQNDALFQATLEQMAKTGVDIRCLR